MNKEKLDSISEQLRKHLDSPEGQESIRKYFDDIDNKKKIGDKQVKKFHIKFGNNLNEIIEKIIAKYDSDKYVRREYKLGFEPREELYWFLLNYAKKYGTKITKRSSKELKSYLNMFTSEAYVISNYVIQRMDGQGSAVKIEKI